MGKTVMSVALFFALFRAGDLYLFDGRYTDAALLMLQEMRRSFGL